MSERFRAVDRDTPYLLPPSVQDWLPEQHLARTMGFLKLGKISLDGSKVQANASKHSALSWGPATELEEQLKAEVTWLMELAAADGESARGNGHPGRTGAA